MSYINIAELRAARADAVGERSMLAKVVLVFVSYLEPRARNRVESDHGLGAQHPRCEERVAEPVQQLLARRTCAHALRLHLALVVQVGEIAGAHGAAA